MPTPLGNSQALWAYDRWANLEILRALEPLGRIAPAERLLAHVLASARVWLDRVHARPQSVPVWPDRLPEDSAAEIDTLHGAWVEVATVEPEWVVAYSNSKGEAFESAVGDIAVHVLMHSAYHRGQIAAEIRRASRVPPLTDFIHYARSIRSGQG